MYTCIVQHVVDLLDSDLLCYVENSITYLKCDQIINNFN